MSQENGSDSDFILDCSCCSFRRLHVLLRALQRPSGIGDSGLGSGSGSGSGSAIGLIPGDLPKPVHPLSIKRENNLESTS